MRFKAFTNLQFSTLQDRVNEWLEANSLKIEVVSTHFTTNTEEQSGDYGTETITRYSAAIYFNLIKN